MNWHEAWAILYLSRRKIGCIFQYRFMWCWSFTWQECRVSLWWGEFCVWITRPHTARSSSSVASLRVAPTWFGLATNQYFRRNEKVVLNSWNKSLGSALAVRTRFQSYRDHMCMWPVDVGIWASLLWVVLSRAALRMLWPSAVEQVSVIIVNHN